MTERTSVSALHTFVLVLCLFLSVGSSAQTAPTHRDQPVAPKVCAGCIRAHMEFLASDALRGRGSGTPDELVAATYVASQLREYGIHPAGDNGTFIQRGIIIQQKLAAAPQLRFITLGASTPSVCWTHGTQMLAVQLTQARFRGPLKRVDSEKPAKSPPDLKGAVALISGNDEDKVRDVTESSLGAGAVAVLAPASSKRLTHWDERAHELPQLAATIEGGEAGALGGEGNVFSVRLEAMAELHQLPEGTSVEFDASLSPPEKSYTWNVVGKLSGRDPQLRKSAILLTAHLDHLGVGKPVNGDSIYNGADDDASGTTAVLELARALASGSKPRRTVIFAFFGSEETGGLGSTWFRAHPPLPLRSIAANLEFEMIGRPDPKYPRDALWLTGWERSNLGPVLAAHGARLVADRRSEEQFFTRSDNYVLARKGVVAQTVSSFGMHNDYHRPSDDLSRIDFRHMTVAIGSLIGPLKWLANSDFRPRWNRGMEP
jgi:aminopeptidase YwaD